MRLALLIFAFGLVGCADTLSQKNCGDRFQLLWPTAANRMSFENVQIFTLKSPYELKGEAAEVYYEAGLEDDGFTGSPARPNLTNSGDGVCIPMDTGSSLAITTYAQFERLLYFDRELKAENQVTWPRKVGVNIHLRNSDGRTHNNAHYFAKNDSVAVIPYTLTGLPIGLNPGILAHEHFHGHFQAQVIAPLNLIIDEVITVDQFFYAGFSIKPTVDDVENGDLTSVQGLNKFVIRAWNEGLADLYGGIFSGESDFFSKSVSNLGSMRDLRSPLGLFKSASAFEREARALGGVKESLIGTSYYQGALLARALYQYVTLSGIDGKAFLSHIMSRLPALADTVKADFNYRVFDFEDVVPVLLEGQTVPLAACEVLRATLSKPMLIERFRQCRP